MGKATFYKDHWVNVEKDRLDIFEKWFQWREEFKSLFAPAKIEKGLGVVDYGCGPGSITVELAHMVGPKGRVFGIDINAEFIKIGKNKANAANLENRLSFHLMEDEKLPLKDNIADRLICKNVLEYAPDLDFTLKEFRRVVKPDGIILVVDSDWGMLVIEPLGQECVAEIMQGARYAFKEPLIGRKLFNAFKDAGLRDIDVQINALADTKGDIAPVFINMCNYAKKLSDLSQEKIQTVMETLNEAIKQETFMMILPQFIVSARV